MEGQRQPGGEEVNGAFRDLSAEIQESLRERIQMEGQRQPGHGGREYRELLAQVEECIRELEDVEERWGGPNPEERRAQIRENIDQRIIEHIERWGSFEAIHEVDQKMLELHERRKRFPYLSTALRRLHGVAVLLSLPAPRTTITDEHIRHDNVNSSCHGCLEHFQLGQQACQLECGHMYHNRCIVFCLADEVNFCLLCGFRIRQAVQTRPSLPREIMAVALPPRITTTVTISISGEHMSDTNSVTSSCPICYDDFKFGEYAGQLNCGHVYHPNCISLWMMRQNTCPVCRAYQ
jgi:hypothetical protein